jgi:hypothetical protein
VVALLLPLLAVFADSINERSLPPSASGELDEPASGRPSTVRRLLLLFTENSK